MNIITKTINTMKLLTILILFTFNCKAQELTFEPRPLILPEYILTMGLPILAFELFSEGERDKKYHFEAGYITAGITGYFLKKHTDNIFIQILGTLLSGYLVTFAKEYIWDKGMGKGTFNKADINSGAWGSNLAMFTYMIAIREKGTVKK